MAQIKQFSERLFVWWEIFVTSGRLGYPIFSFFILEIFGNLRTVLGWIGLTQEAINNHINWITNIPLVWQGRIILILLFILLLEGAFRVVKKKEEVASNLKEKIDKIFDIKLSVPIKGIIFNPNQDGINIILTVRIENQGMTNSVVKNWDLLVQTPEGNSKKALSIRIGSQENVKLVVNQDVEQIIKSSECLIDKTQNNEIVGGGATEGILRFLLRKVTHAELNKPETKFILCARDKHGKEYSTTEILKDIHNKFQ